jgi:hypothetical protein
MAFIHPAEGVLGGTWCEITQANVHHSPKTDVGGNREIGNFERTLRIVLSDGVTAEFRNNVKIFQAH